MSVKSMRLESEDETPDILQKIVESPEFIPFLEAMLEAQVDRAENTVVTCKGGKYRIKFTLYGVGQREVSLDFRLIERYGSRQDSICVELLGELIHDVIAVNANYWARTSLKSGHTWREFYRVDQVIPTFLEGLGVYHYFGQVPAGAPAFFLDTKLLDNVFIEDLFHVCIERPELIKTCQGVALWQAVYGMFTPDRKYQDACLANIKYFAPPWYYLEPKDPDIYFTCELFPQGWKHVVHRSISPDWDGAEECVRRERTRIFLCLYPILSGEEIVSAAICSMAEYLQCCHDNGLPPR